MHAKTRTLLAIQITRHLAAVACIALAIQMTYGVIASADLRNDAPTPAVIVATVVFYLFAGIYVCGLLWLAWRLWARWNASTIRWLMGVLVAATILLLAAAVTVYGFGVKPDDPRHNGIASLAALPLLILAAIAYRRITPKIIHLAERDEPYDVYGHPPGHKARVRFFAAVLGCEIFLTREILEPIIPSRHAPPGALINVSFAALGYLTYRLVIWWMKPKTLPALNAEHAFEVEVRRN